VGAQVVPIMSGAFHPGNRTSVTSVTRVPFFGTPVTHHSLTPQLHTIQCSIAYEMIYLLYYAK
jgi:hypothetical protein